jgi:hypothetical protein
MVNNETNEKIFMRTDGDVDEYKASDIMAFYLNHPNNGSFQKSELSEFIIDVKSFNTIENEFRIQGINNATGTPNIDNDLHIEFLNTLYEYFTSDAIRVLKLRYNIPDISVFEISDEMLNNFITDLNQEIKKI